MASFTFAQDNAAGSNVSATSIPTTLTGVLSSDLIAMCVTWQHATATASISDGTNTAAAATAIQDTNTNNSQWHYYLPGTHANGSITLTATFTSTSTVRSIMAFVLNTVGTVTFDQQNAAFGTSASAASGNITTTGATSIALGGVTDGGLSTAPTAMQINGVGATANTHGPVINSLNSFFRIVSSTFTGQATATVESAATKWNCTIVNFVATDAAPTTFLLGQGCM